MADRFYVLYLPMGDLRNHLDLMRLICNPSKTSSAHLTVRGPYYSDHQPELDTQNIRVLVQGVGVFFGENQNTVFFQCESEDLKRIWWKRDFKEFKPHITIYDGNSREFAIRLAAILERYDLSFEFSANHLSEHHKVDCQKKFDFFWGDYGSLLQKTSGIHLTRELLSEMTDEQRLFYVERLAMNLARSPFVQSHSEITTEHSASAR